MLRSAGAWLLACAALQGTPLPVPPESAQRAAEKTIREIFKDDYARRDPVSLRRLASTFLDQARETKDDPASQFVLLRESADLAARSGDPRLTFLALEAQAGAFQVDESALKEAALAKLEGTVFRLEDLRSLGEAYLAASEADARLERWEAAAKTAQAAMAAAKKAKDLPLSMKAEAWEKSLVDQRSAADRAARAEETLRSRPADPAANSEWGEYLCLVKGNWQAGLACLGRGVDPALGNLARRDLESPADAPRRVELADGWWDLAEKEKNPVRRQALRKRALFWYLEAEPSLTGLVQMKVMRRIELVAPSPPPASKTPPGSGPPLPPGLVVWWTFDEGRGDTATNAVGTDVRGTLQGGAEWAEGRLGKAIRFNGQTSGVTCPVAAGLPAANGPQTIAWWANYPSVPGNVQDMITLSDDFPSSAVQAGFRQGLLVVWGHSGSQLLSVRPPEAGIWHHFAYTFDGTRHSLFIDGKLEGSSGAPPQTKPATRIELGRWWGGPSEFYEGLLDDFRVYTRVLSEEEIVALARVK